MEQVELRLLNFKQNCINVCALGSNWQCISILLGFRLHLATLGHNKLGYHIYGRTNAIIIINSGSIIMCPRTEGYYIYPNKNNWNFIWNFIRSINSRWNLRHFIWNCISILLGFRLHLATLGHNKLGYHIYGRTNAIIIINSGSIIMCPRTEGYYIYPNKNNWNFIWNFIRSINSRWNLRHFIWNCIGNVLEKFHMNKPSAPSYLTEPRSSYIISIAFSLEKLPRLGYWIS